MSKSQRARSPIVEPFIVETKWVRVTVRVKSRHATSLLSRSQRVVSRLGRDVHSHYFPALNHMRSGLGPGHWGGALQQAGRDVLGHASLTGFKVTPVVLVMDEREWRDLNELADFLSAPVEALLRGGLDKRVRDFLEIDRSQGLNLKGVP